MPLASPSRGAVIMAEGPSEAAGERPMRPPRSRGNDRAQKWRNRRPTGKRLDLTPEEAEAAEERKRQGQRKAFIGAFVTDAEKETIAKRAERYGMKHSDFIRTVLLSDLKEPPPPKVDPAAVRELAFQLSKVGTNFNQFTARANEAAKIALDKQLLVLLAMEKQAQAVMAEIAEAVRRVIEL
jgi:hypothetical protein